MVRYDDGKALYATFAKTQEESQHLYANLACVLTARSFAMDIKLIAKPPLTIFLGSQAAFFTAG
jgi:hypothetical protein